MVTKVENICRTFKKNVGQILFSQIAIIQRINYLKSIFQQPKHWTNAFYAS